MFVCACDARVSLCVCKTPKNHPKKHPSQNKKIGNKVFDLLNGRKKLNILEDGKKKVVVVGLREHDVGGVDVVRQLIEEANHRRSVGSTAANADSSRSHSIMQFALKRFLAPPGGGSETVDRLYVRPGPTPPVALHVRGVRRA